MHNLQVERFFKPQKINGRMASADEKADLVAFNRVLLDANEPAEACRQLVSRANEARGRDNITVVVAEFHVRPETDGAAPQRERGVENRNRGCLT